MTDSLYHKFLQHLIKETLSGLRQWAQIPAYDQTDNSHLNRLLSESEFHYIKNGYVLSFTDGWIYLVGEWSESGRDGTVFDGYNLYIQPSIDKALTLIAKDTKDVYRLKNAIEASLKPEECVVSFIQSFLDA